MLHSFVNKCLTGMSLLATATSKLEGGAGATRFVMIVFQDPSVVLACIDFITTLCLVLPIRIAIDSMCTFSENTT